MKDIVLFYFSGSGNSLVAAQEIQRRFANAVLVPIASAIKSEEYILKTKKVGFIFPCHGFTIPIPVKRFLENLTFKKTKYIFAVVTRGGTVFSGFELIEKILKKKNKKLSSSFVIDMPNNDPKFKDFQVPTYKMVEKYHTAMQKKIDIIEDSVKCMETYADETDGIRLSKSAAVNNFMEKLVSRSVHSIAPKTKKYFYATADCIGCGLCAKICPSGKISLSDFMPAWSKKTDCYMCYACMNFCPIECIQIYDKIYMKSHTLENGRYHHPHVTAQDMVLRDR
ncbi:MAG: EFR1 family ferrodoxin [Eubacteriales bacterium]